MKEALFNKGKITKIRSGVREEFHIQENDEFENLPSVYLLLLTRYTSTLAQKLIRALLGVVESSKVSSGSL